MLKNYWQTLLWQVNRILRVGLPVSVKQKEADKLHSNARQEHLPESHSFQSHALTVERVDVKDLSLKVNSINNAIESLNPLKKELNKCPPIDAIPVRHCLLHKTTPNL